MVKRVYPKISVTSLVQRASDLGVLCRRDRAELERAGLSWPAAEELHAAMNACVDTDVRWLLTRESGKAATYELGLYVRRCRKLRSDCTTAIRNALQAAHATIACPSFRESRTRPGLVQDLSDIAVYCRINRPTLEQGNFNFSLAETAAATVSQLATALARVQVDRESERENLDARNAAHRKLYRDVLAICRIGRDAFKNDPGNRRNYRTVK
jgi:hypothetical protein